MIPRRKFIKTAGVTGAGLLLLPHFHSRGTGWQQPIPVSNDLLSLSSSLVQEWGEKLLHLQCVDAADARYGGIISPDTHTVPGRCGDAIYPFFYLADTTKDHRWLDAAMILYQWMDKTVSQPDGSWLNEPVKGSWKGITVFTATALAETLRLYGKNMDAEFRATLEKRLLIAGQYIRDNFTIDYGNINYPISATYCLSLLSVLLDNKSFRDKADALARQALTFITPKNGFVFGEGTPYHGTTAKGCYPIDLGYNVEESLPALVLYGKLNKDEEVLNAVTKSLHTHLEYMLPDGGWDNSWGTRNFKWTYWGSRTSDGCQPAYALMADRDPAFYKAALANTQLLSRCTHDGLLYGGPHQLAHGIPPNVHHTFCHIKALVTTLVHAEDIQPANHAGIVLPREQEYGIRFFADIHTWLIAKGMFRATVTGYDREYKETKNGHPTGGALSLLWHKRTGPLIAASMNQYQLFEAGNMPADKDPFSMPLTPRLELQSGSETYMNISDLQAVITESHDKEHLTITSKGRLVDKDQNDPAGGKIDFQSTYIFSAEKVVLRYQYKSKEPLMQPVLVLPIVSVASESMRVISATIIEIKKEHARVRITANQPIRLLPSSNGRIFNFVPGLEAIPLSLEQNDAMITIEVLDLVAGADN